MAILTAVKKVLVVDDEQIVRNLLTEAALLHLEEEEVAEAGSGEEALSVLGKEAIGLLITDIELPGISGLELIQTAKERGVKKVIAVSGNPLKYAEKAVLAGADGFFEKPFTGEILRAIIDIIEGLNS